MRCPKCGYISFDYNQVCPKCSKDIGAEQAKLNIPSFRPETPFLLETLVGEAEDSGASNGIGASADMDTDEYEMGLDFDDSGVTDTGEMEISDSIEMDEMDTGVESADESVSAFDFEELEPFEGEVEIALEEPVTDFDLERNVEEIDMETGEISEEGSEEGIMATPETGLGEDELGIDLGDVSPDDIGVAQALEEEEEAGVESEAAGLDPDSLTLEPAETSQEADLSEREEEEEVALDLDDLKIGDSGELKVDTSEEAPESEDVSLDLDDLDIELDLDDPDQKQS